MATASDTATTAAATAVVPVTDDPKAITFDDATWILASTFVIFTMQSGFGLLESGCVNPRNEVNIMVKNVVDVIFGGLTYWMFGYAFSFGTDPGNNPFIGWGDFCIDASPDEMGQKFTTFIFQMSFATTATTTVSGAMAERTKLSAYIVFSLLNTIIYCIPAHWVWGKKGFLNDLGVVDISGVGPVHVLGGVTGLVATLLLKPRTGRFGDGPDGVGHPAPQMGCPTNVLLGLFMLWWGWLGFNCGSTFGIRGGKWKLAARSAVTTILSSVGGGLSSLGLTFAICRGKFDIADIVNGVLGGRVSITGMCALAHPWEAVVIGFSAGFLTTGATRLITRLRIDDPVGVIPMHMVCGIWGLLATGLFVDKDELENLTKGRSGLFKGGGFYLLGIQALSAVCIMIWAVINTLAQLLLIRQLIGLRLSEEDELLGSDYCEHNIRHACIEHLLADRRQSQQPPPVREEPEGRTALGLRRGRGGSGGGRGGSGGSGGSASGGTGGDLTSVIGASDNPTSGVELQLKAENESSATAAADDCNNGVLNGGFTAA